MGSKNSWQLGGGVEGAASNSGGASGSIGGFGAVQSGLSGAVGGGVGVTQNLGSLDAQGLSRGDAMKAAVVYCVFSHSSSQA